MERSERLKHLGREIDRLSKLEKEIKIHREVVRDEFSRLVQDEVKDKEYLQPVKSIEIPDEFFHSTGLSKEEFVASRFPGWNVEHLEKDIAKNTTSFVLRRDPNYIPYSIVVDEDEESELRVSKSIAEYNPEIDWDAMMASDPDLFEKIAWPKKIEYEMNEEEFKKLIEEEPEILAEIQRYLTVHKPAIKFSARRVKKDDQ